jgi:hypothetical protein
MISAMPLFDYFAAPSDAAAALVLDRDGGPDPDEFPVLPVKGIEPMVQLGTLEELLTGRAYAEIAAGPRAARMLRTRDERYVVTLTDELQDALTAVDDDELADIAVPWSRTEEFRGVADPGVLAEFLGSFADLARFAVERGERLYCWIQA